VPCYDTPLHIPIAGRSKYGDSRVVQVLADQAQVQAPILRAAVRSLHPGRDDVRVARRDDASGLQPVQAGAHGALRQAGVRTSVATEGKAPVPSGPAWLARPTSTNLHALDGWPLQSAGTGARFSAHEIASTLTSRPAAAACASKLPVEVLAHFPSGAVHQRPSPARLRTSRTVSNPGEPQPAVLESVLEKPRAPGRRRREAWLPMAAPGRQARLMSTDRAEIAVLVHANN